MKKSLENYPELLQDLKSLLTKAQYQAYKAVDNLWAMYELVQFYRFYPIVQAVPRQLSWSHIVCLIPSKEKLKEAITKKP